MQLQAPPGEPSGSAPSASAVTRSRSWVDPKTFAVVIISAILVFLVAPPLWFLLRETFFPSGSFDLSGFQRAFSTYNAAALVWNTAAFALLSTTISVGLGTFLAWYTERSDLPFKQLVFAASLVPLVVPALLYAIAWILLMSPRTGLVAGPLNSMLGSEVFTIYSLTGMSLVQGLDNAPLAFLLMVAAFRSMDPSLEESASVNGAGPWSIFWKVTFPLARPGLIASLLVVGVRSIEAFEIPALIGAEARRDVFTSRIWQVMNAFPTDFQQAGAYSTVLLVISAIIVYSQAKFLSGSNRFATVTGKGFRPGALRVTGPSRRFLASIAQLYVLVAFVLPVGILVYASTQPFYSPPSRQAMSRVTLQPFVEIFSSSQTVRALTNSLILAVSSATVIMALCAVAAWIIVRMGQRGGWLLDNLTFIPFVFPGIVLGVALLFFYVRVPLPIFGTLWVLLIAYVTKFIPYGMRYAVTAMVKINRELEQAGEVSGASWTKVFLRVTLPLLAPGLIAGWIYIAIVSLRELSSSILLYSPGSEVAAILIFEKWTNGQIAELSAFGVTIIAISLVLVVAGRLLGARSGSLSR